MNLNNVLYRRCTLPAGRSPDGETPDFIVVTAEQNGFAVWFCSYEGQRIIFHSFDREKALETAFDEYRERFARIPK